MNYVYVVTEHIFKRAFHAEPWEMDRIIMVCGDYHTAVVNVRDLILHDHAILNKFKADLSHYTMYDPKLDEFDENSEILSYVNSSDHYYESKSYRFKSYDVE